jgi:hypothetical protein
MQPSKNLQNFGHNQLGPVLDETALWAAVQQALTDTSGRLGEWQQPKSPFASQSHLYQGMQALKVGRYSDGCPIEEFGGKLVLGGIPTVFVCALPAFVDMVWTGATAGGVDEFFENFPSFSEPLCTWNEGLLLKIMGDCP